MNNDWTVDPETGRTNASPEYVRIVREIESLIRSEGHALIAGRADMVARLIVTQLAHEHGFWPVGDLDAAAERLAANLAFGASTPMDDEARAVFRAALVAALTATDSTGGTDGP